MSRDISGYLDSAHEKLYHSFTEISTGWKFIMYYKWKVSICKIQDPSVTAILVVPQLMLDYHSEHCLLRFFFAGNVESRSIPNIDH